MKGIFGMFVLGLSFGWGPCLASCGPLLLAYLAGTSKGVSKSVGGYLLFSFSRVFVYLCLGLAVFVAGKFFLERYGYAFRFIASGAGVFIILIGMLMLLGKEVKCFPCGFLRRHLLERDKKSVICLGVFSGLMPCAPLIAAFTYAGLSAGSIRENLVYTFSFGLGTVLSPLLILAALAGLIPDIVNRLKGNYARAFNIVCGLIMVALGVQLIGRNI